MSKTKQIAIQGVLLAIMIVFQTLKNVSVFITGPIVNLVLIIVTYYFSFGSGILFSIIAPISSWLITQNKIMTAVPAIMLFVAFGNIVLCFFVDSLKKKNVILNLVLSSTAKGIFMGVFISLIIIPMAVKAGKLTLPQEAITTARITFSIYQLITAYIASVISYFVLKYVKIK